PSYGHGHLDRARGNRARAGRRPRGGREGGSGRGSRGGGGSGEGGRGGRGGGQGGRGRGRRGAAGRPRRDPLLALDPWLLFLLGMVVALQTTADPAFGTLGQVSRWDGEVV